MKRIRTLKSHIRGKRHKIEAQTNERGEFSCLICQITVTRIKTLQSHILGKKHKNKVRRYKLGKTNNNLSTSSVSCNICFTEGPSTEEPSQMDDEDEEEYHSNEDDEDDNDEDGDDEDGDEDEDGE